MKNGLYETLVSRARGHCEACSLPFGNSMELRPDADHFFTRAKAEENESTVWLIHASCHAAKHAAPEMPAASLTHFSYPQTEQRNVASRIERTTMDDTVDEAAREDARREHRPATLWREDAERLERENAALRNKLALIVQLVKTLGES